jgi:isopentenyldiphosphate isomerase
MWTNTCCSHPLANLNGESDNVNGVRLAARRKLEHELGIPPNQISLEDLKFLTKYSLKFIYVDYCVYKIGFITKQKQMKYGENTKVKDIIFFRRFNRPL